MAKADYYNLLGVSRDASEQELKRAIEHSIDRFVFLKVSIL